MYFRFECSLKITTTTNAPCKRYARCVWPLAYYTNKQIHSAYYLIDSVVCVRTCTLYVCAWKRMKDWSDPQINRQLFTETYTHWNAICHRFVSVVLVVCLFVVKCSAEICSYRLLIHLSFVWLCIFFWFDCVCVCVFRIHLFLNNRWFNWPHKKTVKNSSSLLQLESFIMIIIFRDSISIFCTISFN